MSTLSLSLRDDDREHTKMRHARMDLQFDVTPQPDSASCGPACLHAVYRYFGTDRKLERLLREVPSLEDGGTLGACLGIHALGLGFRATLHTFNLRVFDPTWFAPDRPVDVAEKLREQRRHKRAQKFQDATDAYLKFLERGGRIRMGEPSAELLQAPLRQGLPVLTGLSATFLYGEPRERPTDDEPDDLRGEPVGHFVVLCGFEEATGRVKIADPLEENPMAPGHFYTESVNRVLAAILLGVLTYDANLLVLEPPNAEGNP